MSRSERDRSVTTVQNKTGNGALRKKKERERALLLLC